MKAYTDLNQSKKLAEILPLESADMFYRENGTDAKLMWEHNAHKVKYPCWSLAALLDILPHNLKLILAINDFQGERKERYVIGSVEHDKYDCYANNPIDACYEMIVKLNELKML